MIPDKSLIRKRSRRKREQFNVSMTRSRFDGQFSGAELTGRALTSESTSMNPLSAIAIWKQLFLGTKQLVFTWSLISSLPGGGGILF